MTLNIDQLKKKIVYRSNYRGTKEMDKLLGAFTKKYIESLSLKDLTDLEKLLDIDDTNLYNFYNDISCDFEFEENKINSMLEIIRLRTEHARGQDYIDLNVNDEFKIDEFKAK